MCIVIFFFAQMTQVWIWFVAISNTLSSVSANK